MSIPSKNTEFVLDPRFDYDSSVKSSFEELCKKLNIKPQRLNQLLPARRFPREAGYILGIKLKESDDFADEIPINVTYSACPVVPIDRSDLEEDEEVSENVLISSSEPEVNLYDLKDLAREANDKVANSYNSRNNNMASKTYKKRDPPARLKREVWNDMFGSLTEALCPVCSRNVIKSESFELAHILAEKKGGMTIPENLMPACLPCNRGMGQNHLYYYAWYQYGKVLWPVY